MDGWMVYGDGSGRDEVVIVCGRDDSRRGCCGVDVMEGKELCD